MIQAGALARSGETFVLEIGEPLRIVDLAERIRDFLALERSQTIEITFTGLRPGEKLEETLWEDREQLQASSHPQIRISPPNGQVLHGPLDDVRALGSLALEQGEPGALRSSLLSLMAGH